MSTMTLTRPTGLKTRRVRLATGPAAAAQARRQVQAAICAWDIPADPDAAVLLTSELVTNAIRYETGPAIVLVISCAPGQLRVDIHDTSPAMPSPAKADAGTDADAGTGADADAGAGAEAETGRGLMLVAALADDWGAYRTPAGKAVYFTLRYPFGHSSPADGHGPQGLQTWGR